MQPSLFLRTMNFDLTVEFQFIENLKSNDARKRMVKLTSKGFEILDQAIPLWKEAEDEVFDESKKYGFSAL